MKQTDFATWLKQNPAADLATMMLRAGNDEEKRHKALQHYCRRKTAGKLPSLSSLEDFIFPTALSSEQCTSELLASYHASLISPDDSVADMTAGLGVDSFALARRSRHVTSIEIDPTVSEALSHNSMALGLNNLDVVNADCIEWIKSAGNFDTVFIDPYRRDGDGGRVFALSDCRPDVVANLNMILSHCSTLIIKASPMLDADKISQELGGHAEKIIYVGTPRECKEMLVICHKATIEKPTIEAVTLQPDGRVQIFSPSEHVGNPNPTCCDPREGAILYEPYPSVMKTGTFTAFASTYGVLPIARDTHLFVADNNTDSDIPASSFRIERVLPFDKRTCKSLAKEFTHLNVAVRNFPIKAPELEKRLNIKPGGEYKIYGVTLADKSTRLLLVRPVTSRTYEP